MERRNLFQAVQEMGMAEYTKTVVSFVGQVLQVVNCPTGRDDVIANPGTVWEVRTRLS